MGNSSHSSGPMNVETDQTGACLRRLTAVNTYWYPNLPVVVPLMCSNRPLHVDHGCQASSGRGEHGEETIALHADPFPVMGEEIGIAGCLPLSPPAVTPARLPGAGLGR